MARKVKEPVIIEQNGKTEEPLEETAVLTPAPEYDWSQSIISPLKRYPGTVSFPEHFTMHHYRAWRETNDNLRAMENQGLQFNALTIGYGNGRAATYFDCRQWASVLALADIRLENLPPAALKDTSGESTPLEVLGWLIPLTLDIYIGEKLNLKN
jgi:hypothetical protein